MGKGAAVATAPRVSSNWDIWLGNGVNCLYLECCHSPGEDKDGKVCYEVWIYRSFTAEEYFCLGVWTRLLCHYWKEKNKFFKTIYEAKKYRVSTNVRMIWNKEMIWYETLQWRAVLPMCCSCETDWEIGIGEYPEGDIRCYLVRYYAFQLKLNYLLFIY